MIGPGKYDDEATMVMERVKAQGVILIVCGGIKGEGFAIQATLHTMIQLPRMLREMADQIEADITSGEAFSADP